MSHFPYLIDAPEDGTIEERCWLPHDAADDASEAPAEFERRYISEGWDAWWADEGLRLVCSGWEWLRPTFLTLDEDDTETEIVGEAAEKAADERERWDEVRYEPCDPEAPGAARWWRLGLDVIA